MLQIFVACEAIRLCLDAWLREDIFGDVRMLLYPIGILRNRDIRGIRLPFDDVARNLRVKRFGRIFLQKCQNLGVEFGIDARIIAKMILQIVHHQRPAVFGQQKRGIERLWGDGSERREKLICAGYDYNAVQTEVNKILNQESDCTATEQGKYFSVSVDGRTYSGTLTEK